MIRVYRVTLSTQFRSKLFWICFLCMVIFLGDYAFNNDWEQVIAYKSGDLNLHKAIFGFVEGPGRAMMFMFISVISSVDIMRDRRNRLEDILRCTQLGAGEYLLGKISAYLTLGTTVWAFCTAGYWAIYVFMTAGKLAMYYYDDVLEVAWMTLQRIAAMAIPSLTLYIGIAVSASIITGKSLFGILAGLVFTNLRIIPGILYNPEPYVLKTGEIFTFFGQYIYPISNANADFWYFRHIKRVSEEILWNRDHPNAGRDFAVTVALTFGISAFLFTVSWLKLKRRRK